MTRGSAPGSSQASIETRLRWSQCGSLSKGSVVATVAIKVVPFDLNHESSSELFCLLLDVYRIKKLVLASSFFCTKWNPHGRESIGFDRQLHVDDKFSSLLGHQRDNGSLSTLFLLCLI